MLYNVGKKVVQPWEGSLRNDPLLKKNRHVGVNYMAVRFLFTSSLISYHQHTNDRKDNHEKLIIRHAITSASVQHVAEVPTRSTFLPTRL